MENATTEKIQASVEKLSSWLETHNYEAYDPFDGLNSAFLRRLTLEVPILRIVLQQSIRRFPFNLRPYVGIKPSVSSKGMGFLARGYIRLFSYTNDVQWRSKAEICLHWLMENYSAGYSGVSWGNHFDYQSRVFFLAAHEPTIVWVALIGHSFLDAYESFGDEKYLSVVHSICQHIINDYPRIHTNEGVCINYITTISSLVHNASMLGAGFLARASRYVDLRDSEEIAHNAVSYTVRNQREDGSWFYGEHLKLRWVDNFHTAYVLDSLKHYLITFPCNRIQSVLDKGYHYWKKEFLREDGISPYYSNRVYPIDIQCASQAIDSLVYFSNDDQSALHYAEKVALWTIDNMQDEAGYFYYRKYPAITNKTPTQHWGQATMLCALSGLLREMAGERKCP